MIRHIFTIILLLFAVSSYAATGEILYQNCTAASSCSAGVTTDPTSNPPAWHRYVETTGCQSGSCLKLTGEKNYNPLQLARGIYGAGNTYLPRISAINGQTELTISYYVKFDEAAYAISAGNIKMFIAYIGDNSTRGNVVQIPNEGCDISSTRPIGDFTAASWFSPELTSGSWNVDNGDGTYGAPTGLTKGKIDGSGHPTRPGTDWVKLTHYIKLNSASGVSDGIYKVWIGDELIMNFPAMRVRDTPPSGVLEFYNMDFYSSSEAKEPFEHWMDEMIIYEGYWPPVADTDAPTMTSGTVAGTAATVTADESLNYSGLESGDLQLVCSTSGTVNLSSPTGAGSTISLTAASSIGPSETCTLKGTLTTGDLTDTAGNSMLSFSGKTVTVNTSTHTLTISKAGTGDGTVVCTGGDIDCGSTCSDDYTSSAEAVCTATADGSSSFVGWSGADSVDGDEATISVMADSTLTPTFNISSASCDASHLWLCTDGPCQDAGGYFYESMCYDLAEPAGDTIYTNDMSSCSSGVTDGFGTYTQSTITCVDGGVQLYGTTSTSSAIYRSFPGIGTYTVIGWAKEIPADGAFEVWTSNDSSQYAEGSDGTNQTFSFTVRYTGNVDYDSRIFFQSPKVDGVTVNTAGPIIFDSLIIKEQYTTSTATNAISGVCGGSCN